jgi:hypothetical protein
MLVANAEAVAKISHLGSVERERKY